MPWQPLLEQFGIRQPPVGIVFTPNNELKVQLYPELTGKDKDKASTCEAEFLLLGTEVSNGQ